MENLKLAKGIDQDREERYDCYSMWVTTIEAMLGLDAKYLLKYKIICVSCLKCCKSIRC